MSEQGYNGWSNYATWRVNLEIVDDITSRMGNEIEDGDLERFASVSDLATYLSEEVDDIISDYGTRKGLEVDYARAFLSEVDWFEIAQHWTDELVASDDEEES